MTQNIERQSLNEKQNKLRKMTGEALATLCKSLEEGKSEQMQTYLNVMSKFPKYSFRNLLLILRQNPEATRVMGYESWKRLGRYVKKEEKAIRIWAPLTIKNERGSDESDKNSSESGESEEKLIFRPVCVFDLSQTQGRELPEFAEVSGDSKDYLERLKRFALDKNISISYKDDLRADGISKCGEILLRLGLDPAVEFHVLAHEIAHELIYTKEKRKECSKKQKEVEAESVAYVVSKSIGLTTGTASSDYIQLYNGDKEAIVNSLMTIKKTSTQIIKAILN